MFNKNLNIINTIPDGSVAFGSGKLALQRFSFRGLAEIISRLYIHRKKKETNGNI